MLKTFPKGGIHPEEKKISQGNKTQTLPIPEKVYIPVLQHIGVPARPLVKKGDKVKVGQVIAGSGGFVSTNIHSSVSGTVEKIDKITDSSGFRRDAVIIKTHGDEWLQSIDRSGEVLEEITIHDQEIIPKILSAGIVGLGGATFPSHVKLSVPENKKVNHLIINAVECEPYLTADHRLMLEKGRQILVGARILNQALNARQITIGVENNKPDAIQLLGKLAEKHPNIKVQGLKVKYPQGGEKQLIKAVTGKEVAGGKLPVDYGCMVFNVASTFAAYEAVQKNKPLIERIVTITGNSIRKPGNYWVRIGTPISALIEAAGGIGTDTGKIIVGGPMMGKALANPETPIVKGSSGIVMVPESESRRKEIMPCIRCAKCVTVCPMNLEPYLLMALAERGANDKLKNKRIMDCIECGSCSYICPSYRPLLDYIRLGKAVQLKQ